MKSKEYKGFNIVDGGVQTRKIERIGSGALPKVLRGSYSSTAQAMHAIDVHSEGAKRAKTVSNSRG